MILQGHWVEQLKTLADESVQCCVTSPPYLGLRSYLPAGHPLKPLELGQEKTPEEYVAKLVEGFREVRRALKKDGVLWLNLGDSYCSIGNKKSSSGYGSSTLAGGEQTHTPLRRENSAPGCKHKDLVGIPWRVAFALRADGWYLRQDIIWCLSGGTWIYVRTDESGECLMTVKDLYRIKTGAMLWTGSQWTRILGMSKSNRRGDELELVLRSGERISCTPTHKFPTSRGLLPASEIEIGDSLQRCRLPEPYPVKDCAIDRDAAWMAGLYLAEGSMSDDCIQIAGHVKEEFRWKEICRISAKYGGSCTRTVSGNNMSVRVYGRILVAILGELVSGKTAHDKSFSPTVWRYSNAFIEAMLLGYLHGDGHWDKSNRRWRLGFCRNYNLERDLRTACARLGIHIILKLSFATFQGRKWPSFRGEIRFSKTNNFNTTSNSEVIEIRKSKCREVYDLGVACESHLFSLASGILTHNSKPNPMPESVTDRCTKAHEYIFLLSKNEKYFYDHEAIKEPAKYGDARKPYAPGQVDGRGNGHDRNGGQIRPTVAASWKGIQFHTGKTGEHQLGRASKKRGEFNGKTNSMPGREAFRAIEDWRNKRSVWTVATCPYKGSHFATFPPDLIRPCILAASRKGDTVLDPFGGSGTVGQVCREQARNYILIELNADYVPLIQRRLASAVLNFEQQELV